MMDTLNVSIIHSKRCVDDPSHVYALRFNACPICGCREYTCD